VCHTRFFSSRLHLTCFFSSSSEVRCDADQGFAVLQDAAATTYDCSATGVLTAAALTCTDDCASEGLAVELSEARERETVDRESRMSVVVVTPPAGLVAAAAQDNGQTTITCGPPGNGALITGATDTVTDEELASEVTEIIMYDSSGQEVEVDGLEAGEEVVFVLPFKEDPQLLKATSDPCEVKEVKCEWWDEPAQSWTSSGAVRLSLSLLS
jgi:hypothetical protein